MPDGRCSWGSVCQFERVIHPKSRKERDGISRMVAENILFKSLDEKQHDIVLDAMFPTNFEPGDIIIKQGDDGDNFYILESGVCEVYKDGCLVQTVRTARRLSYCSVDWMLTLFLLYF